MPTEASVPSTSRVEHRGLATVIRHACLDIGIAASLIVCAFIPLGGPVAPAAEGFRAVPLLIASAAALPFRRRRPVSALVATVLVACTGALVGLDTPAFVVPVAVCMFAVAVRTDRRTTVVLGVAAAVLLPLVSLVHGPSLTISPAAVLSARAVQLAAIVAFAAAAGDAARARSATLAAYAERARRAEQSREAEARHRVAQDRLTIARDLHDLVAHQIAVINLSAGVAARAVRTRPDEAEESLRVIGDAARSVITEIGELLVLLRSPDDDPRSITPPAGLLRLDALIDLFEQHGLEIAQSRRGDFRRIPVEVGSVVYRVVQEGLTNALKHGADRAVALALTTDVEEVTVSLSNRAGAMTPDEEVGHGLTGMRERVAALGGRLRAGAGPNGRFRLEVRLPLGQPDRQADTTTTPIVEPRDVASAVALPSSVTPR